MPADGAALVAGHERGFRVCNLEGVDAAMLGEVVLGALEPPGGTGDTCGESALQAALWRQLFEQRRLERREFLRVLAADPAPPFRAFPAGPQKRQDT